MTVESRAGAARSAVQLAGICLWIAEGIAVNPVLRGLVRSTNRMHRVGVIVRRLAKLARRLDGPVVALTQA